MLSGILDRETAYVKPVEAVMRAAALMRGETNEPLALYIFPLTDGKNPVDVSPDDDGPDASPAVPRVVPSKDVPEMAVVGKPEVKVDAVRLVKEIRHLLMISKKRSTHRKVLRSPHAHANIIDIDDTEAVALPGVHAVIHYKNTPRVKYASGGQSWPNPHPHDQVSFDNKVRHVGDRVAAVAAETKEIAQAALGLIKVEYEILPYVLDEIETMEPDSPVIHDEADTEEIYDADRNIVLRIEAERGDVEKVQGS